VSFRANPCTVAANCRWQHLIEECSNEGDLEGQIERQSRATYGGYFPPPRSDEYNLSRQQQKPEGNPAGLEPTKSFSQDADIDPTQRKIEQQYGSCRLHQQ
jgi:hypothetical protein